MEEATGEFRGFSDQVFRFLERVEHRVAISPSEREAAFRLRCEAYRKIGFLTSDSIDKLYESLFGDDPHGRTTTTFVDGELAGTVRVNVGFDENAVLPGLQAFADVLVPRLRDRQVIVEFTRLAARRAHRLLPAHIRGGDVVPAARLSGIDGQARVRGRRLPRGPEPNRSALSLLQVDGRRARGAFRQARTEAHAL